MHARSKAGAGFTIVETMIFLAISGLMFVLAISAMGGKQQQTEFQTSVGTLKSDLNQQLSNVADGNYLSQSGGSYVGCTATNVGSNVAYNITFTATPPTPDSSCTVIGEVIAFEPVVNSLEKFDIFPVFGCNYINCNIGNVSTNNVDEVATDLSQATPAIFSNVSQSQDMPFGLEIADTISPPAITPTIHLTGGLGAIGLFSFTSLDGASSGNNAFDLSSGSQHVEIVGIPNSSVGNDTPTAVEANFDAGIGNCNVSYVCIGGNSGTEQQIDLPSGITFCVNSGTDSESALFTLGGGDSPTSITNQVYDKSGCVN